MKEWLAGNEAGEGGGGEGSASSISQLGDSTSSYQDKIIVATNICNLTQCSIVNTLTAINDVNQTMLLLNTTLREVSSRVDKLRQEESECNNTEVENTAEITRWMGLIQEYLAPKTMEDLFYGSVKVCDAGYIPIGIRGLVQHAHTHNIINHSDVRHVLDSYMWMSWCYFTLAVLRGPPNTTSLKLLISIGRGIPCSDDRFIKPLQTILYKAYAWKLKTKKHLISFRDKRNSLLHVLNSKNTNNNGATTGLNEVERVENECNKNKQVLLSLSAFQLDYSKLSLHCMEGKLMCIYVCFIEL